MRRTILRCFGLFFGGVVLAASAFTSSGCASMETHIQSSVSPDHYRELADAYDALRRRFLSALAEKEYYAERIRETSLPPQHTTAVHSAHEAPIPRRISERRWGTLVGKHESRATLMPTFPCLSPLYPHFSTGNEPPLDGPLPAIILDNRPAVLEGVGQRELWHMTNPRLGTEEIDQRDAPFFVTIICPIYIEQHYDQGAVRDIALGQFENRSGILTSLVFTFMQEDVTPEQNGWLRLVNVRKGSEIPTTRANVANDWYTRAAIPVFTLLGIVGGSMIGFHSD